VQAQQIPLATLEQTALTRIWQVDLKTPMQQVHQVLEALLDVPTVARHADSTLSPQTQAALDTLLTETRRLSAVIDTLTQYISRPQARPGVDVPCLRPVLVMEP
jgi:light-regulated signal transduction histidine kinase (bacteriophytochrome)